MYQNQHLLGFKMRVKNCLCKLNKISSETFCTKKFMKSSILKERFFVCKNFFLHPVFIIFCLELQNTIEKNYSLEQENNVLRTMIQQMQSKINFQDIQLQSLRPPTVQHNNTSMPPSNNNPSTDSRQSTTGPNQMPFANQMIMNSY